MGWAGKAAEISSGPSGRGGGGPERGPKGLGEGPAGPRRPPPTALAFSPKHTSSQTAPGGSAELQERKPPEGLFRPVGRPEVILPRWDFEIIVKSPRRRSGGRTLRLVPEFEMPQDSLDDGGSINKTDNLQRARTAAAEQRIGFLHLLDQTSPRALSRARSRIAGTGAGRRTDRRGAGIAGACAAHMGPGSIVADELLPGVGNVRAESGEEIESGTVDGGRGGRAAMSVAMLGSIGDAAGLAIVVQAIEGHRRVSHISRKAFACLVVLGRNRIPLENREPRVPPA